MKRYSVIVQPPARKDADDIISYISTKFSDQFAAANIERKIKNKIASLSLMPERGSIVEGKLYRKVHIRGFTIFYTVDEKSQTVKILRVISTLRNIEKVL